MSPYGECVRACVRAAEVTLHRAAPTWRTPAIKRYNTPTGRGGCGDKRLAPGSLPSPPRRGEGGGGTVHALRHAAKIKWRVAKFTQIDDGRPLRERPESPLHRWVSPGARL